MCVFRCSSNKYCFKVSTTLCWNPGSWFVSLTAPLYGGENIRGPQANPPGLRPGLRRELVRVSMLQVPPHCGLWGLRLGLDYCSQTLQGQLLFGRMRLHAPAEVSAHPPGEQGQPARHRRTLLYPHQDVSHQHALLQRQGADHLRQDPLHGSRPLRLLVNQRPDGTRSASKTRTSNNTTRHPISVLSARHCAIEGRSLTLWALLHSTVFFITFPSKSASQESRGCFKERRTWERTLSPSPNNLCFISCHCLLKSSL